jgi:transposase-like protein
MRDGFIIVDDTPRGCAVIHSSIRQSMAARVGSNQRPRIWECQSCGKQFNEREFRQLAAVRGD